MSKLHFIDYVQYYWWGDATLLESAGKFLLMDTCHENGIYVIRYLKDYGVKKLDLYVSHDHHDHWGRVVYFINHLKVGKVYLPVDMQGGSTAKKIVAAAKERGIQVIYLKKGSTFTCGTWKFTVVFRRGKGYPNPRSLVTIGEGDGVRFFTAGDLSAEGKLIFWPPAQISMRTSISSLITGTAPPTPRLLSGKWIPLSLFAIVTERAGIYSGPGPIRHTGGPRSTPASTRSAITAR